MRAHAERGGADTGGRCERPTRRPVPAQAGGGEGAEGERARKLRSGLNERSEFSKGEAARRQLLRKHSFAEKSGEHYPETAAAELRAEGAASRGLAGEPTLLDLSNSIPSLQAMDTFQNSFHLTSTQVLYNQRTKLYPTADGEYRPVEIMTFSEPIFNPHRVEACRADIGGKASRRSRPEARRARQSKGGRQVLSPWGRVS